MKIPLPLVTQMVVGINTAHNMGCWPSSPGLVYTLNRKQNSISVETSPDGFAFPRGLS